MSTIKSVIRNMIYEIRGYKVMLDFELAEMYQVETRRLNEAVKRNIKRFPLDFMFQLTKVEWDTLKSQFVISKNEHINLMSQIATSSWGGTRKLPYVFTEQGVAMLSGLLNSEIAIEVNIRIMRVFVEMRKTISAYSNASSEIAELWKRVKMLELQDEETLKAINDLSEDTQNTLDDIYIAIAHLAEKKKMENKPRTPIGFIIQQEEK